MRAFAVLTIAGALVVGCEDEAKKGDVGDPCSNNTDCADSICHAGICVSRNPLKNGAPCENPGYCKSLRCENGVCFPAVKKDGEICLNDEECAAGICTAGICGSPSKPDAGPPLDAAPPIDAEPVVDAPLPETQQPDLAQPDLFIPPDSAAFPDAPIDLPVDAPLPDIVTLPDAVSMDSTALCAAVPIGKACTPSGGQCGASGICLVTDAVNNRGVCTCVCTPDNTATPSIVEDTCPNLSKNICGAVTLTGGTTQGYCLQRCSPKLGSSTCDGALTCHPNSTRYDPNEQHTVCLYYGCAKNSDCPVYTSTICDTTTNICPTGQLCFPERFTTSLGRCAKAGKCDLLSGLCSLHSLGKATAKVGDPCKDDTECASNMMCFQAFDEAKYLKKWKASCTEHGECCSRNCQSSTCAKGVCTLDRRNGYCTIEGCMSAATLSIRTCPAGSHCNRLWTGGLCQKSCSLSSSTDCRNNLADLFGDYECLAWDRVGRTVSGVWTPFAAGPTCDFGTTLNCNWFGSLTCAGVGDATNSTSMSCRSLDNKVLTDPADPTGFCLDNTASGTGLRSPLPTP